MRGIGDDDGDDGCRLQDDPDSHERSDITGVGEHPVMKGILPGRSPSRRERTTRLRKESQAPVSPSKREG